LKDNHIMEDLQWIFKRMVLIFIIMILIAVIQM